MDVDTDFHKFYLKFVKNSDKVTKDLQLEPSEEELGISRQKPTIPRSKDDSRSSTPIQFIVRKAHHFWRNRISMSTAKLAQSEKEWDYIIDKRVSSFYRPYQHFLTFKNLMLIAHRNMLSVFNMSDSEKPKNFADTVIFQEGDIRYMYFQQTSKNLEDDSPHK